MDLEAKKKRFLAKIDGTNPLESKIEASWNKIAKLNGWLVFKFVSPMNNGVPDRIYFRDGVCLMVEFKRRGKKPTPQQHEVHTALRKAGMTVLVIDRIDKAAAEIVFL